MRDRAAARARPGLGPHRTGRPAGGGLEGATETRARALVGSLLLAACSELTPDRSHGGAVFVDRAAELGIALDFDRAREGHYFMPDSLAAGCAFLDYDRDGRLDVFLVNGHFSPEGRVDPEGVSRLFRQTADGRFVDVTASAGIGHRGYGMGVAVGDYDGDGYPDVYVTCYGRDALYRNRGDGTFIDVTEEVGLGHGGWGSSAGFFDAEADGDLDLFVVTYLDYSPEVRSVDQGGAPEYPGPSCCPGTPDVFYRNEGGRFRDVSAAAGISEAPGKGLGLAFGDLDEDGLVDVFVANDSEANRAWIQQDDGSFLDAGVPMGLAFDQFGAPEAGMGVVAADLDGDLTLDLVVTNLTKQTNTFYANGGKGRFRDATSGSGLGPPSVDATGFGTDVVDYDLDGDLDLVCVGGRVLRTVPREGVRGPSHWAPYAEENLLFANDGRGRFVAVALECGELCSAIEVSRGLAVGDFDDDGDGDLLVTTAEGFVHLYRTSSPADAHWVGVRPVHGDPPRDALGAVVLVEAGGRVLRREITRTGSYLSSRDPRARFGLGAATEVTRVEVRWPDGGLSAHTGLEPDRYHVIARQ